MKLLRIVIWIVLTLVLFSLGTTGFIRSLDKNKISDNDKALLENISSVYNGVTYLETLKSNGILTSASVKGNKIIIKYSDEKLETSYKYVYKDNVLKSEIINSEESNWLTTRLLVDAISISKGINEGDTYETFNNIKFNKVSTDEALEIVNGENKTDINIRTDRSLQIVKNERLIDYNILDENIEKIEAFDYTYTNDDVILLLTNKDNNKIVSITKSSAFDSETYDLIIHILERTLSEEEFNEFTESYGMVMEDENLTFSNYEITNTYENEKYVLKITIKEEINSQES